MSYLDKLKVEEDRLLDAIAKLDPIKDIEAYTRLVELVTRVQTDVSYYSGYRDICPPETVQPVTEEAKPEEPTPVEEEAIEEAQTYTLEEIRTMTFAAKDKGVDVGKIVKKYGKNLTAFDPKDYPAYLADLHKAEARCGG